MKIAVVGAGAIGGILAVRLALSGQTVTVVEQGEHLDAIRRNGLSSSARWRGGGCPDIRAVATCADAGVQDLVFWR
jgi:2-dehydropantoate 2-reductase